MSMKVAVQMDPIGAVDIDADSTFRMAEEAAARGHSLFYYHVDDLAWNEGRVEATGWDLTVRRVQGDHFELGEKRTQNLAEMDVVLLRQDHRRHSCRRRYGLSRQTIGCCATDRPRA